MKIAVFHNLLSGGAKRALYEFSRELNKRGFMLDAFIPSTADETFLPLDSVVHHKVVYPLTNLFTFMNHTGFKWMYRRSMLLALAASQKRIASEINSKGYSLAFVHHSILTQSPFILKYLKIPSVYYMQEPHRGVYEHALHEHSYTSSLGKSFLGNTKGLFFHTLIKSIDESNTTHASRILVNSFYSHESVMRAYGLNSYVVYLGVDAERFRPDGTVEKENVIVSVGRLSQPKGFRFIIKALGRLQNKPTLIIIGDGDNEDERIVLTTLAREHKVTIEIKVNISDIELIKLYNRARAVVYAPYLEPFGLVPLEAMACGTPVIGVKEGGVRETVVDGTTGLLVERDSGKFAEAIEYLTQNHEKRHLMGKNAIELVRRKWTWGKATDSLIDHFNAVGGKM